MDQDLVIQDQIAGHSERQTQESYNMDFVQLKNAPYTTTMHQSQEYSAAQQMPGPDVNPSHRSAIQVALDSSECPGLGTQSEFIVEQGGVSQDIDLHLQHARDMTNSVSEIHNYPNPVGLVVNTCTSVVDEAVTTQKAASVVSTCGDYPKTNGSSVGSENAVIKSTHASAVRNSGSGLTSEAMVNLVSTLRMTLAAGGSDSSLPGFMTSDVPDGLCNIQLLTSCISEGARSVKLVTITDVITMSVQFKCKVCEKAFSSPDGLNVHRKTHERQPQRDTCKRKSSETPSQINQSQVQAVVDSMVDETDLISDADKEEHPGKECDKSVETTSLDATQPLLGNQRLCHSCKKSFDSNVLWKHYLDTHMGNKVNQCFMCGKMFQTDKDLLGHIMSFHTALKAETVFCCSICNKHFTTKAVLLNHMLQVHPVTEDTTALVEKTFSNSAPKLPGSGDKIIIMSCAHCDGTGKIPTGKHPCRICKRFFSDSRLLQKHISEHSEKTICALCHKVVFLKSLPKHMMVHTKPRTWNCPHCVRAYRHKCDLTKHLRIHTGEKPYTCEICNKSFAHSSQLPRHLRSHRGEKPHECPLCSKVFSRKFGLNQHMSCHNDEKPYKCERCSRQFGSEKTLRKHVAKHDPVQEPQPEDAPKEVVVVMHMDS